MIEVYLDDVLVVSLGEFGSGKVYLKSKPAVVASVPTAAEIKCAQLGHRIIAIKAVRERTGWGLYDAKALIDHAVPLPDRD